MMVAVNENNKDVGNLKIIMTKRMKTRMIMINKMMKNTTMKKLLHQDEVRLEGTDLELCLQIIETCLQIIIENRNNIEKQVSLVMDKVKGLALPLGRGKFYWRDKEEDKKTAILLSNLKERVKNNTILMKRNVLELDILTRILSGNLLNISHLKHLG